jgi:hypothetical protein
MVAFSFPCPAKGDNEIQEDQKAESSTMVTNGIEEFGMRIAE